MNPPNSTPLTLSVRDAAALTSLSEWEIREAINKLELPARRRGRRLVILRSDLEAFIQGLPLVGDAS